MPRKGALQTDLTGKSFGRLSVVAFAGRAQRKALWLCRCQCGGEVTVLGSNLAKGSTASCGCLKRENNVATWTKHGHSAGNTPEYESWCAMWSRVRAKTGARFRLYGSRGIVACERWLSFESFLADMGPRPPGTSLDRVNNDGNYEPGNCRWATDSVQVSNRRSKAEMLRHQELSAD